MKKLLNNQSTYKKLKKDPIKSITTKINLLIKSWYDGDIIENDTYKRLNCTNGNLPRYYSQLKIHKEGCPLRIIISTIGSLVISIAFFTSL